jgi:LmbE family N-acetylglucosaminyl deacetylase
VTVVVHVSPHPDDEVLGCGATLSALRRAGWTVVNLACRIADRSAPLTRSLASLGFADRRVGGELGEAILEVVADTGARLVVSPHPEDGHPWHETVGRAVSECGPAFAGGVRWWSWGLWRDLPAPTLYFPYGPGPLDELVAAVRAYEGEIRRNPYDELLAARGRALAILGSERVFGYGSPAASPLPYADLLTESRWVDGAWVPSGPRLLDPAAALG